MKITAPLLAAVLVTASALAASAAVTVTVNPSATWLGYMNVSNRPIDGGAFQFGGSWGTADLNASFSGPVLTLSPNTIGDPNPYWYVGGGAPGSPGNKIMEANMYVESNGPLSGQAVTFTGEVLSNTLTSAHTSIAFIKDFAPDYSSFVAQTVALTPGIFSITLNTIADPNRHVQYGFITTGVNVWTTDVAPFGNASVTAVPETSGAFLTALGLTGLLLRRRRC